MRRGSVYLGLIPHLFLFPATHNSLTMYAPVSIVCEQDLSYPKAWLHHVITEDQFNSIANLPPILIAIAKPLIKSLPKKKQHKKTYSQKNYNEKIICTMNITVAVYMVHCYSLVIIIAVFCKILECIDIYKKSCRTLCAAGQVKERSTKHVTKERKNHVGEPIGRHFYPNNGAMHSMAWYLLRGIQRVRMLRFPLVS